MNLSPALVAACVAFAIAVPAPLHARPGEAEENAAARAAARPPVRHLRAIDQWLGAQATARAWSPDAALVWVENADSLVADGSSRAWTFVWAAPDRGETRAFTFTDRGAVTSVVLPFAFEPLPIESGWIEPSALLPGFAALDPAARTATARAEVAVLSRGLLPGRPGNGTAWYVGSIRGAGATFDALRGTTLGVDGSGLGAGDAAAAGGLPAFLAAHRAAIMARLERVASDTPRGSRERPRTLSSREGAALARLGAIQASLDTLGKGAVDASARDVDRSLARLTAWRAEEAKSESLLAASDVRLAAAEKDLAAARPTELALYLSLERRARPAVVRVLVDGAEIARRAYATNEWNALDAGAWAEVVRATVRPGARSVRVEIEGADRRVAQATWSGTLPPQAVTLLRLALVGTGEGREQPPRLERLAGTTP